MTTTEQEYLEIGLKFYDGRHKDDVVESNPIETEDGFSGRLGRYWTKLFLYNISSEPLEVSANANGLSLFKDAYGLWDEETGRYLIRSGTSATLELGQNTRSPLVIEVAVFRRLIFDVKATRLWIDQRIQECIRDAKDLPSGVRPEMFDVKAQLRAGRHYYGVNQIDRFKIVLSHQE